ncbi:hypothetical protein JYU34_017068 [Plutella xylostella]|uniref:Uncharacterized protein n=1 Tax=Plutella xylostella TaxID=51655 RepID=A0ABQ7Q458_PLUXY|nr:hypothetical protein JYU34_017068 [Plutella xylostella]
MKVMKMAVLHLGALDVVEGGRRLVRLRQKLPIMEVTHPSALDVVATGGRRLVRLRK